MAPISLRRCTSGVRVAILVVAAGVAWNPDPGWAQGAIVGSRRPSLKLYTDATRSGVEYRKKADVPFPLAIHSVNGDLLRVAIDGRSFWIDRRFVRVDTKLDLGPRGGRRAVNPSRQHGATRSIADPD